MKDTIIEAKGLTKTFNNKTKALRGADFRVKKGEAVAVMGPSGSGKSTLLHCMAGILKADQGSVMFNGQDVVKMTDKQRNKLRRDKFGFVFQFSQLVPELTAWDNVALPLIIQGKSKKQAYQQAKKWLKKVEAEELAEKLPGQLSGGQAQRIAIARAMVSEPEILFADEPTGSLDSLASEKIMTLFIETVKQTGATLIVITHEPNIAAYADREITVRDGIVVGDQNDA